MVRLFYDSSSCYQKTVPLNQLWPSNEVQILQYIWVSFHKLDYIVYKNLGSKAQILDTLQSPIGHE